MAKRSKDIDGGWAWVILTCGSCALFLNGFMCYSLGVITEALLEAFGEDLSVTSTVGSVMIGVQCCTGPLASFVINLMGCRSCAVLGGIIAMIGLVGASFARDLMSVMWTFGVVTGVGYGFGYTPANVMVGQYFRSLRPLASGITMAGAGLGMFVGPPVIRRLIDVYGMHGTFLVIAGIASHFCLLGTLMRPLPIEDGDSEKTLTKYRNKCTDCMTSVSDCFVKVKSCNSCKNFGFILYLSSIFTWNCAESACLLHLPNYCIQQGSSRQATAFLFTVMGLTNVLSRLFTGFAANDENVSSLTLYMGQMGVACIYTALFPLYSTSYVGQMIYAAGLGMYIGGANSLMNPIVVQLLGLKDLATGFGLVLFMAGAGYMTGPPIAGAIVDFGASYTESYLFAAGMFLISSITMMLVPFFHKESNDQIKNPRNQAITVNVEEKSYGLETDQDETNSVEKENDEITKTYIETDKMIKIMDRVPVQDVDSDNETEPLKHI